MFLREAQRIESTDAAKTIAYTRLAMNGEKDDVERVMRELQD